MEMILPGNLTGWGDVDLENAALDDFRPLYAILAAIEERAVAADAWPGHAEFIDRNFQTGYQNVPSIRFLQRHVAEAIYTLAPAFVNPEPALSFGINHGHDFPQAFTKFDVANSEHPCAALPLQGSTRDTPGALAMYRRFLADAKFWLSRFRYVYALNLGATKRLDSSTAYCEIGTLAETFEENVREIAPRRFPNGSEVYSAERGYYGTRTVVYDNEGDVDRVEESEGESARAEEYSGVWIGNRSPIPADVFVLWGYGEPFMNETLSHPGFYEEHWKYGAQYDFGRCGEGLWGAQSRPTRESRIDGGKIVHTRWTYSPDGTQSKTETREEDAGTPGPGWMVYDESTEKTYSPDGWNHAADTRTDFGTVAGGESLLLLPEKDALDLPPAPEKNKPAGSGRPWRTRNWDRLRAVGPITLHAVLDYGPHYRFP